MMTVFERQMMTTFAIVCVGLLIWAYMAPDQYREKVDWVKDKITGMVSGQSQPSCPTDYEPVCANNQTFMNTCLAMQSGYTDYLAGECQ